MTAVERFERFCEHEFAKGTTKWSKAALEVSDAAITARNGESGVD